VKKKPSEYDELMSGRQVRFLVEWDHVIRIVTVTVGMGQQDAAVKEAFETHGTPPTGTEVFVTRLDAPHRFKVEAADWTLTRA